MNSTLSNNNEYKIAMLSFADIDNFGDILFSDIFEKEIYKRLSNAHIDFFTPTRFECNGRVYHSFQENFPFIGYDAVILAGGEVIHFYDERTWMPVYLKKNIPLPDNFKPSDIVWKVSKCQVPFKAWLSVGVRPGIDEYSNIVNGVLGELDYVSVRGSLSKKLLEGVNYEEYNKKIEITPDLGWLFPSLMPKNKRSYIPEEIDPNLPYVIFQANNITDSECSLIAEQLIKVKNELDVQVCLLPIIKPWEDHKYLERIADFADGQLIVLRNDMSTFEVMSTILNSCAVVSGSLHCALTALANNVPAAIINKWQGTKLQDLFGQQFRLSFLSSDYYDLYVFFERLIAEGSTSRQHLIATSTFMKAHLEIVLDELVSKILCIKP